MHHERDFTSKGFVFPSSISFSFILPVSLLFHPFFPFISLLSFHLYGLYVLVCVCVCACVCVCVRVCVVSVCVKPSMGAVLAKQQSLRTHTRSLDTHCIQLTLHTQSISMHAQETHTHTKSPADRSHTSLHPRQPELHFTVWAYDRSAPS